MPRCVVDDTIYWVNDVPNEEIVRRYAEMGGCPADREPAVESGIEPVAAVS